MAQSLCRYMFRFGTEQSAQDDLKIVLAQISNTKAKVAIVAGKGQTLPAIEFDGNADQFEVLDEAERQSKVSELIAKNEYQVFFTTLPGDQAHVLFMQCSNKTMRQRLIEKKLFKFAKAILP